MSSFKNLDEVRRLERLAVIDKLILRMAVWELQHQPDTPPAVIVNEALELARARRPDIVLLDIYMPGKNGVEVLKELAPEMPKTGFIMITGNEDEEVARRGPRTDGTGTTSGCAITASQAWPVSASMAAPTTI